MTELRIIAEIRSHDGWRGLTEAFRLACDRRNSTYENLGELAGLPLRYLNKVLAQKPMRNIGPTTLGPLMGVTAVKILLVEDDKMFAALEKRFVARKAGPKRDATGSMRRKKRHKWRRFGSIPAERQILHSCRMLLTTAKQRSAWAKRAAEARWRVARRNEGTSHCLEAIAAGELVEASPA